MSSYAALEGHDILICVSFYNPEVLSFNLTVGIGATNLEAGAAILTIATSRLLLLIVLGSDYHPPSSPYLSFPEGTQQGNRMCFNLHTLQDDAVEGDQRLLLSLSSARPGIVIGPIAYSYVTIVDDGMAIDANATECLSMLSDYVVVSITNNVTAFEGIDPVVDVALDIANGSLLECGTITVLFESMDITASELKK